MLRFPALLAIAEVESGQRLLLLFFIDKPSFNIAHTLFQGTNVTHSPFLKFLETFRDH
jgi:hypothetical protein